MNKTIQIQGQTIELPFTEAEYQKIIDSFQSNHKQFPAKGIVYLIQDATHDVLGDSNHSDEHDLACASVAIGLHLAEKEKQEEIERLETALKETQLVLYRLKTDCQKNFRAVTRKRLDQVEYILKKYNDLSDVLRSDGDSSL